MHAANSDRSRRLALLLHALRSHPEGMRTAEIQTWTASMAPATDVSELRNGKPGYRIDCKYEGLSSSGRRIFRYVYRWRNK